MFENASSSSRFARRLTRGHTMLQLRPNCECCNQDLPNESTDARICTFECTFCSDCASTRLHGICPNCGGELVVRPRRPAEKLARYPASTERVFKPAGCGAAA
jgi:hypothetical protein